MITLGTPFHGSQFANSTVRWLGNKLIKLPEMTLDDARQLRKDNPELLHEPGNPLDVRTSIDALAPDSPILPVIAEAQRADWVRYHNIIGRMPNKSFIGRVVGDSDGIVSCESAHQEKARSEIEVNADHVELTRHPLSVLEVHRILLEHLVDVDAPPPGRLERLPFTASATNSPGSAWRAPPPGTVVAPQVVPPLMAPQVPPPGDVFNDQPPQDMLPGFVSPPARGLPNATAMPPNVPSGPPLP